MTFIQKGKPMQAEEDIPVSTGDRQEDLRARVRALMAAEGLSQAQVAREADLKAPTVNQWLSAKYPGDNDGVAQKIEIWLVSRSRRQEIVMTLPEAPAFAATPTARKILSALAYAQAGADLVAIYGGAGVGKTESIRHYKAINSNVWVATMAPDTAQVVPALEEVLDALGIKDPPQGARRMARSVRHKLEGGSGLLIIDEAQHLSVAALEELRSIHDAAPHAGLALVGNETIYSRLTGGNRSAAFAQLFSRIGMRVPLTRPRKGDVQALAAAWGVKGTPELAFLEQIAAKPGALRGLSKCLRMASMLAKADGRAMVADDMRGAWLNLDPSSAS